MGTKSVVAVNCNVPTAERYLDYFSGASLRDYDIAIFNPRLPYQRRIDFDGGGSCLTIESTSAIVKAMAHWSSEFTNALRAGKTVFVILDEFEQDMGASGSTLKNRNQRTYSTFHLNNYAAIPAKLDLINTKGSKIVPSDSQFQALYEIIKNISEYRVILTSTKLRAIFKTKDGAVIGATGKFTDLPGTIVLLPYFEFGSDRFTENDDDGELVWSSSALSISKALLGQMIAIDKVLGSGTRSTPPPDWISEIAVPDAVAAADQAVRDLDKRIDQLQQQRAVKASQKEELMSHSRLLYETGKPLERAIEKALRLLGFSAEGLDTGALEIDHVIISPSGKRMIGESEGKDNSAIDITKFRQLESNIGEDFQRDEVVEPAKGVLFGNGFRLTKPEDRAEQFTQKSLMNASRLGSALVRTGDLYSVVSYLLDNPNDEAFKSACRAAIEDAPGGIVEFPKPVRLG